MKSAVFILAFAVTVVCFAILAISSMVGLCLFYWEHLENYLKVLGVLAVAAIVAAVTHDD